MPISCNAVGDIIALVQLGIKIAEVLSESRKAPADCRALCNDLRSLERLIALSRSTIDDLQDHALRELVDERLDDVSHQIMDGLKLICDFDAAFDVSADHTERHWRQTLYHLGKISKQSITWAVKRNASARDARITIAQSFTSLIFALLVAFQADQRSFFQTLRDAHDALATDLAQLAQNLTTGQDDLHADISELDSLFDKLLRTLDSVREEVAGISARLERNLARTQLDMAAVRQQLHDLQTTTATTSTVERVGTDTLESIERLGVAVQQGFTLIEAHFTSGDLRQGDRNQLAAWLMANPLILTFANILYPPGHHYLVDGPFESADRSSLVGPSVPALVSRLPQEAVSPPVIAATFLLALRATNSNERAAYAILTFLLFMTSKMLQLYKTPSMSHIVFVVDLFDSCVEVTISNANSSTLLHRALVSHFEGQLGYVLLRKRKYELRFGEKGSRGPQCLPSGWNGLLRPGDRIYMNALVEKPRDQTVIICPACSTWIADRSAEEEAAGWMECPNCPATVKLSDSTVDGKARSSVDHDASNRVKPDHHPLPQTSTSEFRSRRKSTNEQERASEEAALRKCRRIHIIESAVRHLNPDQLLPGLGYGIQSGGRPEKRNVDAKSELATDFSALGGTGSDTSPQRLPGVRALFPEFSWPVRLVSEGSSAQIPTLGDRDQLSHRDMELRLPPPPTAQQSSHNQPPILDNYLTLRNAYFNMINDKDNDTAYAPVDQNLTDSTVNLDAQFEAVETSLHSIMQMLGLSPDVYPTHFDGQDQSFGGPLDFDGVDNGHGFGDDGLDMDWKAILEQMDDSRMTSLIDPVVTSAPATVAPTAMVRLPGSVSPAASPTTTSYERLRSSVAGSASSRSSSSSSSVAGPPDGTPVVGNFNDSPMEETPLFTPALDMLGTTTPYLDGWDTSPAIGDQDSFDALSPLFDLAPAKVSHAIRQNENTHI